MPKVKLNSGGFLLIDKITNETSFQIIAKVRRALNIKKVGHAGTLDPLATGLLIVAVGNATRLLDQIITADKSYQATIMLGASSDTYDSDGIIAPYHQVEIPTLNTVKTIITQFIGKIMQQPPRYSALKINGKKSCNLARQGIVIPLTPRPVTIKNIKINNYDYPQLEITTTVSSGTYIRSLAHDIGTKLTTGGYITALRRLSINQITLENQAQFIINSAHIAQLGTKIKQYYLPLKTLFPQMSYITLTPASIIKFRLGQRLHYQAPNQALVFITNQDKLIGTARIYDHIIHPKKVFN